MQPIFLDHSTTTPIAASVRESMLPYLNNLFGHPTSSHWLGRAAAEAMEDARSSLAGLLDCHPSEIIFTSGGTESVNLAILGAGRAIARANNGPGHCITTNLEHPSVRLSIRQLQSEGWKVSVVNCNRKGIIDPMDFQRQLRPDTRLVSVAHAAWQLGTIQPLEEISQLCQQHNVVLHTDAGQTVGKIVCNVQQMGIDLLSLSGHKFYAPKGVGALYVRLGVPVEPLLFGEGGECGLRPGTPNVAHVVGMGQAAKLAQSGLQASIERVVQLREKLRWNLEQLIGRPLTIHNLDARRLPGVLMLQLPDVAVEDLQQKLPEIYFGPSASRTAKIKQAADDALVAMGLSSTDISSTLRISIGWSTSEDELIQAAHRIAAAYESLLVS